VQALFAEQLVSRRKIYRSDVAETLGRLAIPRGNADYGAEPVGLDQAGRALRRAREFVAAVRRQQETRR